MNWIWRSISTCQIDFQGIDWFLLIIKSINKTTPWLEVESNCRFTRKKDVFSVISWFGSFKGEIVVVGFKSIEQDSFRKPAF